MQIASKRRRAFLVAFLAVAPAGAKHELRLAAVDRGEIYLLYGLEDEAGGTRIRLMAKPLR